MSHVGDNLASFFRNVSSKIEELQVQSSLGKAEAEDKWESIKKEARQGFEHLKNKTLLAYKDNQAEYDKLKAKLEHLEVQMALGKAETKDLLAEQKKNLMQTLHELKTIIDKA